MKNNKYNFLFLFKIFLVKIFLVFLGVVITQAYICFHVIFSFLMFILLFEAIIISFSFVDVLKNILITLISYILAFSSLYVFFRVPLWIQFIILFLAALLMLLLLFKTDFVYNVYNTLTQNTFIHTLILFALLLVFIKLFLLLMQEMIHFALPFLHDHLQVVMPCPAPNVELEYASAGLGTIRPWICEMRATGSGKGFLAYGHNPLKGSAGAGGNHICQSGISSGSSPHGSSILSAIRNWFGTDIYAMTDKELKNYVKETRPEHPCSHIVATDDKKEIATTLTTKKSPGGEVVSETLFNGEKGKQYLFGTPFEIGDKAFFDKNFKKVDHKNYTTAYQVRLTEAFDKVKNNTCDKTSLETQYKQILKEKNNVKPKP